VFIEAMDDGGGAYNWTTGGTSRAQLQSNHHHQQTNIQSFLQAGCPSCRPTNSVKALIGKNTEGAMQQKLIHYIQNIVKLTRITKDSTK